MWLAFSVLGAFACERLSRRVKALEGVLRLLKKTELEIRQFSRPLPQLAEIIADEEKGDGLAAECVRFLKAGESFPSAWQKGTEKSPLPFKAGSSHDGASFAVHSVVGLRSAFIPCQRKTFELRLPSCVFSQMGDGRSSKSKAFDSTRLHCSSVERFMRNTPSPSSAMTFLLTPKSLCTRNDTSSVHFSTIPS